MSVYYEAVKSGRIKSSGWSPAPRLKGGVSCKGIRNAVRRMKNRRELERLEARVTKRSAAAKAEVRHG